VGVMFRLDNHFRHGPACPGHLFHRVRR